MNYYCDGLILASFPLTNANFSVAAGRRTLAGALSKAFVQTIHERCREQIHSAYADKTFLSPQHP